jgi:hypothetical protein
VQEYCEECEGEALEKPNRVVRRDPALADNKQLPRRLQLQVGRTIYQKLLEGFRGETFDCPGPLSPSASAQEVQTGIQAVQKTFVKNGFAINASMSPVQQQGKECTWTARLEGSANLWGMQALRARRAVITDAFEAFAVLGFLDASGWDADFSVADVGSQYVEQSWSAKPQMLAA